MSRKSIIQNILSPIERFLALQTSSGILLLGSAILALFFANSPLKDWYNDLLHFPIAIGFGNFLLEMSLHHWVNDGLMVIFFFVVGLEIKRELVGGSLSSKREAFLPFIAALGGMVVPALIYIAFNTSQESIVGWGIPMATDIAFAVGVLAFILNIPLSLKIFLLALATIDDLGAVLVIAFFYSTELSGFWMSISGVVVFLTFCFRQLRVHSYLIYIVLGTILWFAVLKSGIHATIAGVILGLMTPARPLFSRKSDVDEELKQLLSKNKPTTYQLEKTAQKLRSLQSPAQLLIDRLHGWVSFIIMPVFAFCNSGLRFDSEFSFSDFSVSPVFYGIFLGLFVGKPVGIFLFSWISVHLKWTQWPAHIRPLHILGVGYLAGIGFTMALFISSLSLSYNPILENYSKASIFLASLLSGIAGFLILFIESKKDSK
ncbi:MAG: Na+/H+ antiporter NhaA [Bdellovibrionales bacterium]|nr:Na+/H+ antiporter NhaA [Bdellovibrionales bacterium]